MLRFYKHEEEKNKVGRPRLADDKTKKKAIISVCIALVLVLTLLLTGAFKLNIINLNKLKGTANVNLCSEIPAKYQPRSESNPEGLYEYGFTDPKFYSAVVSTYNSDSSYCSTITEDELKGINNLYVNSETIDNADGVQYLTGIKILQLNGNGWSSNRGGSGNLTSIDISKNTLLTNLRLSCNKIISIDLSQNTSLTYLDLYANKLTSIDLNQNKALTSLDLGGNNLSNIDSSGNPVLATLNLSNNNLSNIDVSQYPTLSILNLNSNNLSSIDVSQNKALTNLSLNYNNLSDIDLSQNTSLTYLDLYANKLTSIDLSHNTDLTYLNLLTSENIYTYDEKVEVEKPSIEIKTAYTNKPTYAISNPEIAIYNNGTVERVKPGQASLIVEYKISDRYSYRVYNYIYFEKLLSSYYEIDDENKTIDAKNEVIDINNIYGLNNYSFRVNNDILEVIDYEKNIVVDSYKIINQYEREKEAYLKAGFKGKEFYDCVVSSVLGYEYISGDYLLTDEELQNVEELYCINRNIKDTTGIEKLIGLRNLYLSYNNIETIDVSHNPNLELLWLENNKLTSLDLSNNPNLVHIQVQNNNISKIIGLDKLEKLGYLFAYNNNLSNLDISKTANLEVLMVSNNPLANTLYMLKGKEIDYKKDFKLNEAYEIKYDIDNTSVILYEDSKIKALKEGITNIYLSNESIESATTDYYDKSMRCSLLQDQNACEELERLNEEEFLLPYLINQEVKVYDITSKEYTVDKDTKTIDALNKDFDASKVSLTLNGLMGTLENDKFVIKDGETVVDTYTVKNIKQVVKEEVVSNSSNGTNIKPSDKVIEKLEDRKEKAEEKLEDIIIEEDKVSLATLLLVKGKDRNIIVKQNGITITINGKDIDKVTGNLDLSYELKVLKDSIIYNEVKDKINIGMVLSFKGNNNLPGKVLVSLDVTDNIKKNVGTRNLRLYSYKNGELTLVAENINPKDKKLSFYVNELGNYVLTNKELEGKEIKEDTKLLESNNKINHVISFKCLLWLIIILIILGIIGYVIYKKNKDKNN